MPLYCSLLASNIPHALEHWRRSDTFTLNHVEPTSASCFLSPLLGHKPPHNLPRHISFVSKFDRIRSSPAMEEDKRMFGLGVVSEQEECSKELDVAVRAVQMACSLCQKVQGNLVSKCRSNDDYSAVKVAGWSVQAIVSWILSQSLGSESTSILAEDDLQTLTRTNASELLESVVKTVNECLAEAPRFGVQAPKSVLGTSDVLEIISRCSDSAGGPSGRFWTLSSPVDNTKGFAIGDQYAVSLSLIEDGAVVLGVLGCPNYPMRKEWFMYPHSYLRIMSKLVPPATSENWNKGCVVYAKRGSGMAWKQPILSDNENFLWPNNAKRVSFSCSIDNLELATFCHPLDYKANSSHSFAQGLAHSVGLRKQPLRVDNTAKYAAIANGDAEVFMKFARAGNKEKVWDHAAGVMIIQEAGGTVTDARGRPLDFTKGLDLEGIDRGIVACAGAALHEKMIDAVDASWASSCL